MTPDEIRNAALESLVPADLGMSTSAFRNGMPDMDKITEVVNCINADDDLHDVLNLLVGIARGIKASKQSPPAPEKTAEGVDSGMAPYSDSVKGSGNRPDPKSVIFKREVAAILNRESIDNDCETPDWILAEYLWESLQTFSKIVRADKLATEALKES